MTSSQQSAAASEAAAIPAVWSELTPGEAALHLAHLRRWARGLNIAMLVLIVLGACLLPSSTWLSVLLALIPWVAIALTARYYPLVTLVPHRHETVRSLGLLLLVPSIITSLRASVTMEALDKTPLAISAVLSALLVVAGAALVDPAVRQWRNAP